MPTRFPQQLTPSFTWALCAGLLVLWSSLYSLSAIAGDEPALEAQHILERRCIVCHGCYDAPCQLKLEAAEGLTRGASKKLVYDGTRLIAAETTRLFDDGFSEQQWRDKGFFSVLRGKDKEPSLMQRMLELKQNHPFTPDIDTDQAGFDFSLARAQQCAKPDEFDQFAQEFPLWGMPYGLPGLEQKEHDTLSTWLDQGALNPVSPVLAADEEDLWQAWEAFLNGDSDKQRLMSRYLYEHLFLAALHLNGDDQRPEHWYRIVRSSTPPGKEIDLISTRRPYDDPKVDKVYYRLQNIPQAILAKRHMPYRFDQQRMDWYQKLFLDAPYQVDKLPGYSGKTTGNPFKTFASIPVKSRYEFLLYEAQFSIMNFIKGPVCRGQIALNVIEDRFWVMFLDPDKIEKDDDPEFLKRESDNMSLPQTVTGTFIDLLVWNHYARDQTRYQKAKSNFLIKQLASGERELSLDSIWDGDGQNANAGLTIMRHFDTASVEKGLIGEIPKTAWVIDYSLLERIHYLLVAGFDVYGSLSHQLQSRLFMDFLRMEGEFNFLLFIPIAQRNELLDYWYRNAHSEVEKHFLKLNALSEIETDISYTSKDAKSEFLNAQRARIYDAAAPRFDYHYGLSAEFAGALDKLQSNSGSHNSYLPQVSFVDVLQADGRSQAYSLIRDSGYSNIAQLIREEDRRLPAEDKITVVKGFIGAYPNYFFQVNERQLPLFVEDILALKSSQDYQEFIKRYGVRRNAPWFWRVSDKFHDLYRKEQPLESGLFDYNRYQATRQ